jgi:uncharacterized membrane protein
MKDVRELSSAELETLATGIAGFPPARAGAARDEISRREREYAEKHQQTHLRWTKVGVWAAIVGAVAAIIAAAQSLLLLIK